MIEAEHVAVTLGGARVLDDVGFSLPRGQIMGLIGPPASGKTVLIKAVAALVDLSAGRIQFDGARVDGLARRPRVDWQLRIGMAFQNDALFDALTVFDNVAFPLRRRRLDEGEVKTRVEARLSDVGLLDARDKVPAEISGGMRKRVGIARATVITPEVGLFDDPVAGLDPVTGATILDLIVGLTASLDMTTIICSNDLAVLMPLCRSVLMLNEGRVVYDGPPNEMVRSERPEVVQFATGGLEGPL